MDSGPARGRRPSAAARRELPSGDAESAAELVRAKLRTFSPNLDRATATRRLVGMLARRGYPSGIAYAAVSAELAAWVESGMEEQPAVGMGRRARAVSRREAEPRSGSTVVDAGDPSSVDDNSADASEPSSLDDERERAAELVRAKLRGLPPDLDREKTIRRLVGLLARRGFGQSIAYSVVKDEMDAAARGGG
ncbi:hypothetical protein [Nocardia sp. CDC160]|uniref:hypothetical protein n=1 Tax=Nocardia sp. CDC160 TaxID=3112166 RepID=UPI003FA37163